LSAIAGLSCSALQQFCSRFTLNFLLPQNNVFIVEQLIIKILQQTKICLVLLFGSIYLLSALLLFWETAVLPVLPVFCC